MKVEIWSDIACPWCYIGKRRFERALSHFSNRGEVEIVWRSFELDPNAERAQAISVNEMLAKKYRMSVERAAAMNANLTAEGTKEGIDFRLDRVRLTNTFDAHRLTHLAATAGKREAMVDRLFRAYFTEGRSIGDVDELVELAEDVGLDPQSARRTLESNDFADAVRADEDRARTFGITGVPFFAINEQYGISGAQQPEVILDALGQALSSDAVRSAG